MDFSQRIQAVFKGEAPDRVPCMSLDSVMPRGDLELGLRQRGMGLCLTRPVVWCEYPHVDVDVRAVGDIATLTYHTPRGDLSLRQRQHVGRIRDDASCDLDGLVKTVDDLEAAIALAEDAVFHVDESAYNDTSFEIGADGLVRCQGPQPPYDLACELAGYHPGMLNEHQVLTTWLYLQESEPQGFARLLEALDAQEQRRLAAVMAAPTEMVLLGCLHGQMGPERWRDWVLPFYRRVVPELHAAGKICVLHAHAANLAAYADLVAATGVDIIEGITPPPLGTLSLGEARRQWGDQIVLWVNLPPALFAQGGTWLKDYVQVLVREGQPQRRLIIGAIEEGLLGLVDDESEALHYAGYHALLDALGYPQ